MKKLRLRGERREGGWWLLAEVQWKGSLGTVGVGPDAWVHGLAL